MAAFVDDLRTRCGLAEEVDPQIAERPLLATFTDEEIDDIDGVAQGNYFEIRLADLVAYANFSDSELDMKLDDARKLADEWLSTD